MATENIAVGVEPIQITDGTNSALVTVLGSYAISFAESDASPDINAGDYLRDRMVIHPPLKVWVWNANPGTLKIAVTRWTD